MGSETESQGDHLKVTKTKLEYKENMKRLSIRNESKGDIQSDGPTN